jgi:two-component system cell cycle sensor histidine kinase/response regulator CckA
VTQLGHDEVAAAGCDSAERELLQALEDMKSLLRRTISEDVILQTDCAPELPPILADLGQNEQLVMNLVVNARDAMPMGGIVTLRTRSIVHTHSDSIDAPDMAPGSYVHLTIMDTGVGMDAATLEHVFKPS